MSSGKEPKYNWEEIFTLHDNGTSNKEIMQRFGMCKSVLCPRLQRRKLKETIHTKEWLAEHMVKVKRIKRRSLLS